MLHQMQRAASNQRTGGARPTDRTPPELVRLPLERRCWRSALIRRVQYSGSGSKWRSGLFRRHGLSLRFSTALGRDGSSGR